MIPAISFGHGVVIRTPVVGLFYNNDAVSSFCQVLCAHSTTTSAADNNHVCFDDFGLVALWNLNELVVVAFTIFHPNGHAGNTHDTA
jgi:hypothetical protein